MKTANAVPRENTAYVLRKDDQNAKICDILGANRFFEDPLAYYAVLDDFNRETGELGTSSALTAAGVDPYNINVANIGGSPRGWYSTPESRKIVAHALSRGYCARETDMIDLLKKTDLRSSVGIFDACCGVENVWPLVEYYVANNMVAAQNGYALIWVTAEMHRTCYRHKKSLKLIDDEDIVLEKVNSLHTQLIIPPWWKRPIVLVNEPDTYNKMHWICFRFELATQPSNRVYKVTAKTPEPCLVVYKKTPDADLNFMRGTAKLSNSTLDITYEFADGSVEVSAGPRDDLTTLTDGAMVKGETRLAEHPEVGTRIRKTFLGPQKGPKRKRKRAAYEGTVTKVFFADDDETLFHVVYDDGDEEDFDSTELEKRRIE